MNVFPTAHREGFISKKELPLSWEVSFFYEQLEVRQSQAVVAHTFNLSTQEAEAGGFLSSRPAWSTDWVPGQPVWTENPCQRGCKKKHLTKITREHSSWSELGAYIKKFFHEASEITHQTWACVKPFYHLWSSSQLQTLRPRNDHSNSTQRKLNWQAATQALSVWTKIYEAWRDHFEIEQKRGE